MPSFEYTGQLTTGGAIAGVLEAESPNDAQQRLAELEIHVTSLAQARRMPLARPLSRDDVMFFNEQLASMAGAGIALDQGLRLVARDLRTGRLRGAVTELAADLERGVPLEDAVARRGGLFPPLYAEVLKAGTQNNQLGATLANLNAHLTLLDATRRVFWEAAVYPAVVFSLGFALLSFFMWVIVPQFATMLGDMAGMEDYDWSTGRSYPLEVPLVTRALIAVASQWSAVALTVAGAIAVVAIGFGALRLSPAGRRLRELIILIAPGVGGVYRASLLARFTQAAALSAKAGLDLPAVLRLAAGATGSARLLHEADALARHVEAGGQPVQSAARLRLIPALFGYAAHIAGGRGQLAAALGEMARGYDALARHRIGLLRAVLFPLLVIASAVVLGLGIIAMFLPLISLINSLQGGG